jgi:hypothetical protein
MAKFLVTVPVTGTADFIVFADSEEEAKEKMLNGGFDHMEGNALDIDHDSNNFDVEDVSDCLVING